MVLGAALSQQAGTQMNADRSGEREIGLPTIRPFRDGEGKA